MHRIHRAAAYQLAVALFPAACRDSHTHDHAPAEEAEPATRQVTEWRGRFEIFLEHRLPVAGAAVPFVTHVSDLEKAAPRTAGPITLRFEQEGATPVEITDPAPARAGIYIPDVMLPRPGVWKPSIVIPADGADHVVPLPDLTVFASEADASRAELPAPPEGISFLKEQQWRLRTRAEPVARQRLIEEMRVAAVVTAPTSARARVTPPIAGRLLAQEGQPWPQPGMRVSAGDVLGWVEPPLSELVVALAQADAEVAAGRVALEQAEAALLRMRTLAEQRARTQRELEEATFAAKGAQARLDAALAVQAAWRRSGLLPSGSGAALPRLALVSPIDGVVTRVGAVVGEFASPGQELFALLDPRVVHVDVRVPEIDLPRLGTPLEAAYAVPGAGGPPAPITGEGGGRLAWRDVEMDAATRTLTLHFELPDPEGRLAIGQALVAHLTTKAAVDALALPESALVDEDGRPVAFVQLAGETFEKRDLVLGIRDRGLVEVKSGLADGERVMVDGAYSVRLASVSTTLPAHGHAH